MKLRHNTRTVPPGRNVWDGGASEPAPRYRHPWRFLMARKQNGKLRPRYPINWRDYR